MVCSWSLSQRKNGQITAIKRVEVIASDSNYLCWCRVGMEHGGSSSGLGHHPSPWPTLCPDGQDTSTSAQHQTSPSPVCPHGGARNVPPVALTVASAAWRPRPGGDTLPPAGPGCWAASAGAWRGPARRGGRAVPRAGGCPSPTGGGGRGPPWRSRSCRPSLCFVCLGKGKKSG